MNGVTHVFATTMKLSCYSSEVPIVSDGPNDGQLGMSACGGAAKTL